MFVFLMLLLHFPAAVSSQTLHFTVRDGSDVTLPCDVKDQHSCSSVAWSFRSYLTDSEKPLEAEDASGRLRVAANCSLLITKVKVEDVGRYACRQTVKDQRSDALVYVSVVTMTEQRDREEVVLNCSVWTDGRCQHAVRWLYNNNVIDESHRDLVTSGSACVTAITFPITHYVSTSLSNLFTCDVTSDGKKQIFTFIPPPAVTPTENSIKEETITTDLSDQDASTQQQDLLGLYIFLAVALVALLIIIVAVIMLKRTRGNKPGSYDDAGLTSNPAATQETSQDTADPEDGVSYASVSYTKKTDGKAKVRSKNEDDEGDRVAYSTVKASSTEPSVLYATVK